MKALSSFAKWAEVLVYDKLVSFDFDKHREIVNILRCLNDLQKDRTIGRIKMLSATASSGANAKEITVAGLLSSVLDAFLYVQPYLPSNMSVEFGDANFALKRYNKGLYVFSVTDDDLTRLMSSEAVGGLLIVHCIAPEIIMATLLQVWSDGHVRVFSGQYVKGAVRYLGYTNKRDENSSEMLWPFNVRRVEMLSEVLTMSSAFDFKDRGQKVCEQPIDNSKAWCSYSSTDLMFSILQSRIFQRYRLDYGERCLDNCSALKQHAKAAQSMAAFIAPFVYESFGTMFSSPLGNELDRAALLTLAQLLVLDESFANTARRSLQSNMPINALAQVSLVLKVVFGRNVLDTFEVDSFDALESVISNTNARLKRKRQEGDESSDDEESENTATDMMEDFERLRARNDDNSDDDDGNLLRPAKRFSPELNVQAGSEKESVSSVDQIIIGKINQYLDARSITALSLVNTQFSKNVANESSRQYKSLFKDAFPELTIAGHFEDGNLPNWLMNVTQRPLQQLTSSLRDTLQALNSRQIAREEEIRLMTVDQLQRELEKDSSGITVAATDVVAARAVLLEKVREQYRVTRQELVTMLDAIDSRLSSTFIQGSTEDVELVRAYQLMYNLLYNSMTDPRVVAILPGALDPQRVGQGSLSIVDGETELSSMLEPEISNSVWKSPKNKRFATNERKLASTKFNGLYYLWQFGTKDEVEAKRVASYLIKTLPLERIDEIEESDAYTTTSQKECVSVLLEFSTVMGQREPNSAYLRLKEKAEVAAVVYNLPNVLIQRKKQITDYQLGLLFADSLLYPTNITDKYRPLELKDTDFLATYELRQYIKSVDFNTEVPYFNPHLIDPFESTGFRSKLEWYDDDAIRRKPFFKNIGGVLTLGAGGYPFQASRFGKIISINRDIVTLDGKSRCFGGGKWALVFADAELVDAKWSYLTASFDVDKALSFENIGLEDYELYRNQNFGRDGSWTSSPFASTIKSPFKKGDGGERLFKAGMARRQQFAPADRAFVGAMTREALSTFRHTAPLVGSINRIMPYLVRLLDADPDLDEYDIADSDVGRWKRPLTGMIDLLNRELQLTNRDTFVIDHTRKSRTNEKNVKRYTILQAVLDNRVRVFFSAPLSGTEMRSRRFSNLFRFALPKSVFGTVVSEFDKTEEYSMMIWVNWPQSGVVAVNDSVLELIVTLDPQENQRAAVATAIKSSQDTNDFIARIKQKTELLFPPTGLTDATSGEEINISDRLRTTFLRHFFLDTALRSCFIKPLNTDKYRNIDFIKYEERFATFERGQRIVRDDNLIIPDEIIDALEQSEQKLIDIVSDIRDAGVLKKIKVDANFAELIATAFTQVLPVGVHRMQKDIQLLRKTLARVISFGLKPAGKILQQALDLVNGQLSAMGDSLFFKATTFGTPGLTKEQKDRLNAHTKELDNRIKAVENMIIQAQGVLKEIAELDEYVVEQAPSLALGNFNNAEDRIARREAVTNFSSTVFDKLSSFVDGCTLVIASTDISSVLAFVGVAFNSNSIDVLRKALFELLTSNQSDLYIGLEDRLAELNTSIIDQTAGAIYLNPSRLRTLKKDAKWEVVCRLDRYKLALDAFTNLDDQETSSSDSEIEFRRAQQNFIEKMTQIVNNAVVQDMQLDDNLLQKDDTDMQEDDDSDNSVDLSDQLTKQDSGLATVTEPWNDVFRALAPDILQNS